MNIADDFESFRQQEGSQQTADGEPVPQKTISMERIKELAESENVPMDAAIKQFEDAGYQIIDEPEEPQPDNETTEANVDDSTTQRAG